MPGAVILSRSHECSDCLWESLVDLEYFLKNPNGKGPHSSILAWRIPWMCSPWGRQESDTTEQFSPPVETALGVQRCRETSPSFSPGRIQHTNGLMTYDC